MTTKRHSVGVGRAGWVVNFYHSMNHKGVRPGQPFHDNAPVFRLGPAIRV